MKGGHRSHVSSKKAKARGWSRVPSWETRQNTWNMITEAQCNYMANDFGTISLDCCNTLDYTISPVCSDIVITSGTGYYWDADWYTTGNDTKDGSIVFQQPQPTVIREIIKEKVVTKEVQMRTLWEVYVVDPRKGGKVLAAFIGKDAIVAENENQAMLKAGIAQIAINAGREIEQLDVYTSKVGTFIRPLKETQRVKIAKHDDDD